MRTIVFALTGICVISLIIALFIFLGSLSAPKTQSPSPSATLPTPVQILHSENQRTPAIKYDQNKSNEFYNLTKNRQTLSSGGSTAKQKLVLSLNGSAGKIYSSSNIIINYLPAVDLFQTEILNPNITASKQEAVNWLVSQGFTKDDTCKLPLNFYLSPSVSDQIRNTDTVFNPLPDGC